MPETPLNFKNTPKQIEVTFTDLDRHSNKSGQLDLSPGPSSTLAAHIILPPNGVNLVFAPYTGPRNHEEGMLASWAGDTAQITLQCHRNHPPRCIGFAMVTRGNTHFVLGLHPRVISKTRPIHVPQILTKAKTGLRSIGRPGYASDIVNILLDTYDVILLDFPRTGKLDLETASLDDMKAAITYGLGPFLTAT
jgi:hypothetical protein